MKYRFSMIVEFEHPELLPTFAAKGSIEDIDIMVGQGIATLEKYAEPKDASADIKMERIEEGCPV
jgi:hypothetical protein